MRLSARRLATFIAATEKNFGARSGIGIWGRSWPRPLPRSPVGMPLTIACARNHLMPSTSTSPDAGTPSSTLSWANRNLVFCWSVVRISPWRRASVPISGSRGHKPLCKVRATAIFATSGSARLRASAAPAAPAGAIATAGLCPANASARAGHCGRCRQRPRSSAPVASGGRLHLPVGALRLAAQRAAMISPRIWPGRRARFQPLSSAHPGIAISRGGINAAIGRKGAFQHHRPRRGAPGRGVRLAAAST